MNAPTDAELRNSVLKAAAELATREGRSVADVLLSMGQREAVDSWSDLPLPPGQRPIDALRRRGLIGCIDSGIGDLRRPSNSLTA